MMHRFALLCACLAVAASAAAQSRPAPNDTIAAFSALQPNDPNADENDKTAGSGPLRLTFSDGTKIYIPNEAGDYKDGSQTVPQALFEQIQLAPDRKTIGWLADYMMCAQSYPCPLALVLYRAGAPERSFSPATGTIWGWMFTAGGNAAVVHSGFPHGDLAGAFTLIDTKTGKVDFQYAGSKNAPAWVRQYLSTQRN